MEEENDRWTKEEEEAWENSRALRCDACWDGRRRQMREVKKGSARWDAKKEQDKEAKGKGGKGIERERY